MDFFSAIKKEYDNIYIIVYLRRQDRYLESTWNQHVKWEPFTSQTFKQFVTNVQFTLEYKKRLDQLSIIFGYDHLIVRAYEKEQFQGKDVGIVGDFLFALGIDLNFSKCIWDEANNPSLTGNFIEIKRRMNAYLKQSDGLIKPITLAFMQYFTKYNASTLSNIKHADGMFTLDERQEVLEYYSRQNVEIARKYLKREDGILFYDKKEIPMYHFNDDTLCDDIEGIFIWIATALKQKNLMFKNIFQYKQDEKDNRLLLNQLHNIQALLTNIKNEINSIRMQSLNHRVLEEQCFELVEKYTQELIHLGKVSDKILQCAMQHVQYIQQGKKIILIGIGGYCEYFLSQLHTMREQWNKNEHGELFNGVPQILVDNNQEKQGKIFHNAKIHHASEIQNWKDYFVIIMVCELPYIEQIEDQLHGYGLKRGENYILGIDIFPAPWMNTVDRSGDQ